LPSDRRWCITGSVIQQKYNGIHTCKFPCSVSHIKIEVKEIGTQVQWLTPIILAT
jgi:hypothetical protein